jgi:hypothetical protein
VARQAKYIILGEIKLNLSQFSLILTLLKFEFSHFSFEAPFLLQESLILLLLLIQLEQRSALFQIALALCGICEH